MTHCHSGDAPVSLIHTAVLGLFIHAIVTPFRVADWLVLLLINLTTLVQLHECHMQQVSPNVSYIVMLGN